MRLDIQTNAELGICCTAVRKEERCNAGRRYTKDVLATTDKIGIQRTVKKGLPRTTGTLNVKMFAAAIAMYTNSLTPLKWTAIRFAISGSVQMIIAI